MNKYFNIILILVLLRIYFQVCIFIYTHLYEFLRDASIKNHTLKISIIHQSGATDSNLDSNQSDLTHQPFFMSQKKKKAASKTGIRF